jgi:hypothetical protein
MVMPLVDLPDAERQVIDVLLAAGHGTVKTDYPSERLTSTDYWLQVDQEPADSTDYPVLERAQVRITAHVAPGRRTAVKAHASDALADLCSFPGNSSVSGIFPRAGRSDVSADPDTGNLMCWVLVRVDLKASLAS